MSSAPDRAPTSSFFFSALLSRKTSGCPMAPFAWSFAELWPHRTMGQMVRTDSNRRSPSQKRVGLCGGTGSAAEAIRAVSKAGDRGFESRSLQRRVHKPSVPPAISRARFQGKFAAPSVSRGISPSHVEKPGFSSRPGQRAPFPASPGSRGPLADRCPSSPKPRNWAATSSIDPAISASAGIPR
jgi:hypothetical protein